MSALHVDSVQPTPFLQRNDDDSLSQFVRVRLGVDTAAAGAELTIHADRSELVRTVVDLEPGTTEHELLLPEQAWGHDVKFTVSVSGTLSDHIVNAWPTPRKWRVHIVQLSHHDVGYTDLASHVLPQHVAFLDRVIDMADATTDWPVDSQFRMVIEGTWSLWQFLRTTPPSRAARMLDLLRSGQVEVGILFGNMTTELCGHETLVRCVAHASALRRQHGIPLVSAEHNDIPGFSWGLSEVLADCGVRIFCPGLPQYYRWGSLPSPSFWNESGIFGYNDMPGAFWWETPSGRRILFWCNNQGCGGDHRPGLPGLSGRLQYLADNGYPYDLLRWPVKGGARDNSPYIDGFVKTIRKWNASWAYPKLISSTNAMFAAEFAETIREQQLPVLRGELPGQDYPVGATSTASKSYVARPRPSTAPTVSPA